MTGFETPFVVHVRKRCRVCRGLVTVDLCGGATEPADGFYVCSDCANRPAATDAALERSRPQMNLIEGGRQDG